MKITKKSNGIEQYHNVADIRLSDEKQEGKSLNILYGGNGDLYWLLKTNKQEDTTYETFSVSKEDYEVYKLFDDLYHDIINTQVFKTSMAKVEEDEELTEEERNELIAQRNKEAEMCQRFNTSLKDQPQYQALVQDGIITWFSDETNVEEAEIFRISPQEDEYLIEFIRQNTKSNGYWRYPGSINVRISNSGSKYQPFNMVFIRQFNNFQTFERDPYHQIHMEEYLYQRKTK